MSNNFVLRVSLVAALGGLLFGFDTAIISGAIPFITPYFDLNEYSLGWAVGSILIGCGSGAVLAGPLADAYGRRSMLFLCAGLFGLSGIGTALAGNLAIFVAFRLIGGIGVGAAAMVAPMYIAEIAPARVRGRLVALYQLAIVSGILLAYYVNYALSGIGENNWRWMFATQIVPSLLFGLLLLGVPDTPRWLVRKRRHNEAIGILQKTVSTNGRIITEEISRIEQSFNDQKRTRLADLFASKYLPLVWTGVVIAVFQQVTGINSILYYAPVIFRETGLDTSGSLMQTIGIGIVNVFATFIAIGLVDKVGRKKLLLAGSLVMGASLTTVAICFHYQYFENYIVLISMLIYVGAFGCTLGAVTWVLLSEIFPNRIRGLALSLATLSLWIADFVVTFTFPVMTGQWGTSATLLTYAVFCGIAFIYILLKVPETRGKSLEEIERTLIK